MENQGNTLTRVRLFFVLIAWAALQSLIAHNRSIWIDEWLHFEQIIWPIRDALKSLFEEISPFAPGQLMLGRFFHALTGGFPSDEFSGRLSSVLMGTLALWTSLRMNSRLFPWIIASSVTLCAMSTQSRPYSALMFCSAIALKLILDSKPLDRVDLFLTIFGILFGHIYGICFIAMALFFRGDFKWFSFNILWLGLVLWAHLWPAGKLSIMNKPDFPPFIEFFGQLIGTLGNPKKGGLIFFPFFIAGLFNYFKNSSFSGGLKIISYFAAVLAAPIAVNFISNYPFMPRQVVGGTFGYLYFTALGISLVLEEGRRRFFKSGVLMKILIAGILARACVFPLVSFLCGRPPFIDQPISKTKKIIQEIIDNQYANILWADSGLRSSAYAYLRILLKEPHARLELMMLNGFDVEKSCWMKSKVCVYAMTSEQLFTGKHVQTVNENPEFLKLVNGAVPKFDLLVVTVPKFKLNAAIKHRNTY